MRSEWDKNKLLFYYLHFLNVSSRTVVLATALLFESLELKAS